MNNKSDKDLKRINYKLEKYNKQISHFKKLKLSEANKLIEEAKNTKDKELRKKLYDEVILGTLYIVYDFVKKESFKFVKNSSFDIEDIISTCNELWIEAIYSGSIQKVHHSSQIFRGKFYSKLFERLTSKNYKTSDNFTLFIHNNFGEYFKDYIKLKSNNEDLTFKEYLNHYSYLFDCYSELRKKRYSVKEKMYKKYYDLTKMFIIFEEISKKIDINKLNNLSSMKLNNLKNFFLDIVSEVPLNECIVNKINIIDNFIDEMFYEYVRKVIDTNLIGRNKKVLYECFGINCIKKTHIEIAKELIITREHVYKIEAKALRKLRKQNDIKNIREYYNF